MLQLNLALKHFSTRTFYMIVLVQRLGLILALALAVSGCELEYTPIDGGSSSNGGGGDVLPDADETGVVVNVIDGDTIDVNINGDVMRVRYVGVNTPERDQACYSDARSANERLVMNQTVSLVRDQSDTDQYDRLLRYVYVGNTFVNAELVRNGYAESVLYRPDDDQFDYFVSLEREAASAGRGCHPTGIFDDGNTER